MEISGRAVKSRWKVWAVNLVLNSWWDNSFTTETDPIRKCAKDFIEISPKKIYK